MHQLFITADNVDFVILGINLFIRIMKLKNSEMLFFMLSPAFHRLGFLWNFIPK